MVNVDSLVYRLHAMQAPREFMLIVLMVIWTHGLYDLSEDYDWLEFFAGHAACTTYVRLQGFRGCKFDLKYNQSERVPPRKSDYMDVNSVSGFILAIIFLLKGRYEDFVAWYGIKCSSWTQVNVGTSSRSPCASLGDISKASVLEANRMVERISLLLILTTCLGGCWVLEQPSGSTLEFYPTFRWVIAQLFAHGGVQSVARVAWWMKGFGAATAKPQYAYSNSPSIRNIKHYACSDIPVKKDQKVKTCKVYKNQQGKACYTGTSSLKATEIYPDLFGETISNLMGSLKSTKLGCPKLPAELPDALDSFKLSHSGSGTGLFDHCDLESVFKYLRKCHTLEIPKKWEDAVPKSI